ncbi:MAG: hypothetical protein KDI54_03195 [Gammaproteobacteria bacterium]|nr:hypothetical protein [Gammaproteobacteria bacterium]
MPELAAAITEPTPESGRKAGLCGFAPVARIGCYVALHHRCALPPILHQSGAEASVAATDSSIECQSMANHWFLILLIKK